MVTRAPIHHFIGRTGRRSDVRLILSSLIEQLGTDPDRDLIYRFCYRSGRLVDKQAFQGSR